MPQYHLVERRAIGGAFSRAPRLVKTPAEPEPPPPDPSPPRTPPRAGRGAIFGKMTAPRLSGAALAAWQLPPGGPAAVPASPAPTELSDAATDIAPLADLDAAVRSLGIIPAASTPYRSLPNLTANLNSTFLTRTLTLGTAVHPRVLTQTTHSLTLTLSP